MKSALGLVSAVLAANVYMAVSQATVPPALPNNCLYPVDLVFLVDSSESFRTSGFNDAKTFLQNVVNYFTLGENDTRVGVVTFSNEDEQVTRVRLNENYTRVELLTEIRNIPYDRGHTFTGLGLDHVRNNSFLEVNGRRNSTLDFLVVLTDDESEDNVSGPAQLIRDMGITVFAVGVGPENDISQATLETIAGDPNRVFRLTDHDELVDSVRARAIGGDICNATNLCDPHPCHVDATCRLLGRTFECSCNIGFVGDGFTCSVVQCPVLSAPVNGALSPAGRRQYQDVVTFTCNSGYNLVGATSITCQQNGAWTASPPTCNPTPTCQADGTWSHPVPVCTPVECPVLTTLTNGALSTTSRTYQTVVTFTCNSGYVLNGFPTTTCQAGGTWSNSVPTCTPRPCPLRAAPTNGAVSPTGAVSYPDGVTFTCSSGYTLNGAATATCQASGAWSDPVPTCTPRPCPALTAPTNGALSPLGPHAFPTVVTFTCNSGYVRNGAADTTCRADGTWSNPVPTCTAVQCPARTAPANGAVTPTGAVSYPNSVTFTCNTGYTLNGVATQTCRADGTWSNNDPTCTLAQCPSLTAPANGALSTTDTSFNTVVTITCNSGYVLNGVPTVTCQAGGTWSNTLPTCPPRTCSARAAPANGAVSPTGAVSYPNSVTFTCNTGYTLNGVAAQTCRADGTWSHPDPTCTQVQCPPLTAPANGALSTTVRTYLTVVTFTCNPGYNRNGATSATCQADGTWSNSVPTCTPVQCSARAAPANGAVSPTGAVSYPNGVTFTCNTGYALNGVATPTCQADTTWSNPVPTCILGQCSSLTAPANGALSTTATSYLTVVTFTCNAGYVLTGATSTTCQANGAWSNPVHTCTPVQCTARTAPANGAVSPTGPVSYPGGVTFTCNSGYTLSGVATSTCQADRTWSDPVPTCPPRQCPPLTAPTNGVLSTTSTSYLTVVGFTCNSGYVRTGAATATCQDDGTWSGSVPTCTRIQCSTLTAPSNGALSPAAANSYQDVVTFTCNSGYTLNGATAVTCRADGTWSNPVPTCTGVQCPALTAPANGGLSPTGAVSYPNEVTFTCDPGYRLVGVDRLACRADGTWNNVAPTCRFTIPTPLANTCPYAVDLVFLVDSSSSWGANRFENAKTFVQNVANYFTLGENDTRVGVVTYNDFDEQVIRIRLNENYTRVEALTAIRNIPYESGISTFTGRGLEHVSNNSFLMAFGQRKNMLVVLTDGNSTDDVNATSQYLRRLLVSIFAVGVGEEADVSQDTLQTIAGDPTRVFRLTSYDFLTDDNRAASVRQSICDAVRCPALPAPTNGALSHTGLISPQTVVTFTCNPGYSLDGQSTITCLQSGFYTGPIPTCIPVQCPNLTAPANGAVSPTGAVSYPNGVTFSCDSGYGLSGVATLTCRADGTWSSLPPTCQPGQCSTLTPPTNGALSPVGATSFQNVVTFTCNPGYERNGASSVTCQANLIWSAPVPTCDRVQCPLLGALANGVLSPSGATSYQDVVQFICNQGYEVNGPASTTCQADQTWSNPVRPCQAVQCPTLTTPANGGLNPAGPHFYQNQVTFTCNQGYGLSGASRLTCQADGMWSNSVPSCILGQCPTLAAPANGGLSPTGTTAYQTVVTFTCNLGYQLVGDSSTTCQAGLTWSSAIPTCQPVPCPTLAAPANGIVSPTGAASYQDQVQFICNAGYSRVGAPSSTCQANGTWSDPVPACNVVQCPTLVAPTNGALSPTGATSYLTVVTFTCNTGYDRNGAADATCQADGTWSRDVPTCTAVTCPTLTNPANGVLSPSGSNSYQNTVTLTCDAGYQSSGVSTITCQADRSWSAAIPTCNPVQCQPLTAPVNGGLSPAGATSYQVTVLFTCNQGYELVGAASATCRADQTWSETPPTCRVVQCPLLSAPVNGALSPSGATSYNDAVTFTCDTGYQLNGPSDVLTCRADGTWSNTAPTCTVVRCLALTAPANGALSPAGANSYTNVVTFTCNQGYERQGASSATCQADGTWSNAVATCIPVQCQQLTAPANGVLSPTGPISYQNGVDFRCNVGYQLNGASRATCQADQTWSANVPTCTVVQCPLLTAPANGALSPAGVTAYNTVVRFTCVQGYVLTGAADVTCQADGTWSARPTCRPVQCPILSAPDNGSLSTGANSYQTVVTFNCNLGYERVGFASAICQFDSTWSNTVPTCRAVQCPLLTHPANGVVNPIGRNSYQDVVRFTCNTGFELNGEPSATCRADRTWSEPVPTCTDINECRLNMCHSLATCTNTIGSFRCNCFSGYSGDGFTCRDINECAPTSPCHQWAVCTNLPGSFMCNCTEGYIGNGFICAELPCDRWTWRLGPGVFCGDPGAPASGAQQGTYYQGGQVDFSCDDGYTLVGNSAIRCQVTATWSGTLPTCRLGDPCAPNPCINGGQCFPTITSFRCRCASGYLGQTCNRQLQCPTLQAPTNGNLSPIGVASNQTVVTFTCNSGYTLTGDATTTCQADERWSNPVPTCTPVQCSARAAPANGAVSPIGAVSYPNGATFTCNTGYTLSGAAAQTCRADGTWSNAVPTCSSSSTGGTQCPARAAPTNGAVSHTGAVSPTNSITFTCSSGYTLNGDDTATCQADGTWDKNSDPTCTRTGIIQCPTLTAPTNGVQTPPSGPYNHEQLVMFTCNSGYSLNGNSITRCQMDGTWSNAVPTCTPTTGTTGGLTSNEIAAIAGGSALALVLLLALLACVAGASRKAGEKKPARSPSGPTYP
ncbi:PREDICTED: sushi, von Willebrand factor type A, EGF and pentraxin domain-containing protein 1-like [Branchiostoma belcheri]|uniref:Sushi, von Willebrand factor type A, EGF and pentraxin domain-containing protein 1-like n=1 Tax=Branchiostoma belcheri TaxID=7741 RepID=A0A6P4YYC2_BRABE|nr:PREDICTED: sushi, von Willebrand factor type A, EGF and pentraxin domain-containing protein 1-like [Branchiostoma belcheri]